MRSCRPGEGASALNAILEEKWSADTAGAGKGGLGITTSGGQIMITIPLERISAGKEFVIKQCNSTMIFDPRYYTEIKYRLTP